MPATSIRTLVVAAAAALCVSGLAQAGPELRVVVGTVEIGSGNPPSWRMARSGDLLQPGDAVRTGAGARAELETAAGTIRMYERSTLRIPPAPDDSSRLGLDRGASVFDIRHRPAGRPFQVETPHAVVMVKGTRFAVRDDEEGSSVSVQRGLVSVRSPGGSERELLVHPGFGVSGGAGRSFALGFLPQDANAWDDWSHSSRPPEPSLPPRESRANPGLASARSAAHDTASQQVAALAADARGAKLDAHHADGDARRESQEAEQSPASMLRPDPLLDEGDGSKVKQGFGEALLGGPSTFDINVQESGGQDQVHIVGSSGLDVTLTESQLQQVVSGNTSLLGPQLLNVLGSRGVSPTVFATQMLDLL